MLLEGHYWQPHVNGAPYLDKPPLYFWAVVLASLPGGRVSAVSARLPSVIAGLLVVLLSWDLARRLPLLKAAGEQSESIREFFRLSKTQV